MVNIWRHEWGMHNSFADIFLIFFVPKKTFFKMFTFFSRQALLTWHQGLAILSKMYKLIIISYIAIQLAKGEPANGSENSDYDPWKESNQPKIFVDYLRKPLSGRYIFLAFHICNICKFDSEWKWHKYFIKKLWFFFAILLKYSHLLVVNTEQITL